MKNRNKYTNLASGLAFWALNNGSVIFTLLSLYGLMMIRDFTIKQQDNKLKSLTEALLALAALRGAIGLLNAYTPSGFLSYSSILINIPVFIISIFVLKQSLSYLSLKLKEFELVNLVNKVKQSFYIIIIVDAILIGFLLLVLFTLIFPNLAILNFVSIFLNPTFNMFFSLSLTFIKYYASRSYSRAAIMLTNATQLEERM